MGISVVKETAQYGESKRVRGSGGIKRFLMDPHSEKPEPKRRNNDK